MRNVLRNAIWLIGSMSSIGLGQEFRSEIQGLVLDPTNLPVVGAQVRAVNEQTGLSTAMMTGTSGGYLFLQLPPGRYRLEASAPGFKGWTQSPIELDMATKLKLDVKLEVGQIQEQVTVSAATPMVSAIDASIDQVVRERQIVDLPIEGRNVYALLVLSSDVQPTSPGTFTQTMPSERGNRSLYSIAGSQVQTNEVLLDGTSNLETGKLIGYPASPDVVQEFKVQSNFDAEFGYSLGGVVNAVTKAGTNEYHGAAWNFLRNNVLRASDFFANRAGLAKPAFRMNQFGGAVGGPIRKNKVFFFGSYEGVRQRQPATVLYTLPTQKQRQGDFSETFATNRNLITIYNPFTTRSSGSAFVRDPFPNNQIPASLINPFGKAAISFYPDSNRPGDPFTAANNYAGSGPSAETFNTVLSRVDYNLSSRQRLFARYIFSHPKLSPFNSFHNDANPNRAQDFNNHLAVLDYTNTISPGLVLTVRTGFTRYNTEAATPSVGFDLSRLNLAPSFISQVRLKYFPTINVTDSARMGDVSGGNHSTNNQISLQTNINKITGRHSTKFGLDGRFQQANNWQPGVASGNFTFARNFTQGPNPLTASVNAGYGVASLLLGTGSGSADISSAATTRLINMGWYINDTWRVTPKLVLNLGLRYENYLPVVERFDRANRGYAFDTVSPLQAQAQAAYAKNPIPQLAALRVIGGLLFANVGGVPRGFNEHNQRAFAPRLGLAYSFTPRTVLRAGYGISYDGYASNTAIKQSGFSQSTTWVGSLDGVTPLNLANNPFPTGLLQPSGASQGLLTAVGGSVVVQDTRARTPYIHMYELSVQHELIPRLLLEAAYIGNSSWNMVADHQLDQYPDQFLSLGAGLNRSVPNPFFGLIPSGTVAAQTTTVAQLLRPFPQFTGVDVQELIGRTWYNSARFKVEKRFSAGFSFLASYRVSKLMDRNGYLNNNDLQMETVIDGADSPQRLVLSGSWELPFGPGHRLGAGATNGLLQRLIGGWQFNWINTYNCGFPVAGPANAVSTGKSAKLSDPTIAKWFDTSAFVIQQPFTLRTLSSSLSDVRTDGYVNFDLSLLKTTRIRENWNLQFRAEFFNATNTPLFGAPNTNVQAALFGVISNQANKPREIQFALKLRF